MSEVGNGRASDSSLSLEGPEKTKQTEQSNESDTSSSSSRSESSGSSSSSSDDSNSDSTDGSDDEPIVKTVSKKSVKVKLSSSMSPTSKGRLKRPLAGGGAPSKPKLHRGASATSVSSSKAAKSPKNEKTDEEGSRVITGVLKKKTPKQALVAQFLKRWWYALPPWPPENYDYKKVLEQRKLKWVTLEEWEDAEDVDENGYTKVYQISSFPGIFRDPAGQAIDLRDKELCPSYSNFKKKSEVELLRLISKAITKQLEDLQRSPYDETLTRANLRKECAQAERELGALERREEFLKQKRGTSSTATKDSEGS